MVNLVNFGLWFWNFCEILHLERPCWQVSSVKPISIFCEILHFFQIFEKYFKKSHFYTVLLSTLKKRPVDFKWFSQWSKKQFSVENFLIKNEQFWKWSTFLFWLKDLYISVLHKKSKISKVRIFWRVVKKNLKKSKILL